MVICQVFVFCVGASLPVSAMPFSPTDSLMRNVYSFPHRHNLNIGSFESEVYSKFHMRTTRRNVAMRMLNNPFHLEKGNHTYIGECVSRFSYSGIGKLQRKDVAFYSTMPFLKEIRRAILNYSTLLVYNENLLEDRILSPFNEKNKRFYKFLCDSTYIENDSICIKRVCIKPKIPYSQLVEGTFMCDNDGRVMSFSFNMLYDNFLKVNIIGEVGTDGAECLLAKHITTNATYRFMKNKVNFQLKSDIRYPNIKSVSAINDVNPSKKKKGTSPEEWNDNVLVNTTSVIRSLDYFNVHRPYPLMPIEDSIYAEYQIGKEEKRRRDDSAGKKKSNVLENFFFDTHNIRLGGSSLRVPALIAPSTFQWSQSKGFSIQTRVKWNCQISDNQSLSITPRLGYNFKQTQFYWRIPITYNFSPSHNAGVQLTIGNGNHAYNSRQAKEVRDALRGIAGYDSLVDVLKKYQFNYYRDFYTKLRFNVDPFPGLQLKLGTVFHHRSQISGKKDTQVAGTDIRNCYKSLAPYLEATWTPRQFYYTKNGRKHAYYSFWPTFSVLYERGICIFSCRSKYERWEFDAQYNVRLSALKNLYFRTSAGFFTSQKNVYFVDYANFNYQSLPLGADDDWMGQFQLLDKRWYNESDYYAMFCSAYQSPYLLVSRIPVFARFIKKERLYMNVLMVNALKPYAEIGYGLKTSVVDFAVFTGMANRSGCSVGVKIALSLFEGL